MQELRYILVALGGIAIAALLIHGLWTNRKNRKSPIKEKPLGRVEARSRDDDSFDDDGIGQVRVVSSRRAEPKMQPEEPKPVRRAPPIYRREEEDDDEDELPPLRSQPEPAYAPPAREPAYSQPAREPAYTPPAREPAYVEPAPRMSVPAYEPDLEEPEEEVQPEPIPVRKPSPVIRRNPVQPRSRPQREPVMSAQLDEEPMAPAYEPEPVLRAEPSYEPEPEPIPAPRRAPVEKTWQDVYVLNLMARPGRELEGGALLSSLLATGFKFGEMEIFHRHEDADGHGEVLFSIINMVKPGTFNPYRMEQFTTPGVSLFMQLPLRSNAALAYEEMLRTADQLASDLDAMLTDMERSPLSDETVDRCRRELAAYEASRD
ncbi:cell division protein ZipA [Aeromonas diversa]|uniref:cell division protein ZipA n=1 Tax=Aeromonas diversa TaxID=502790 RepID=UPI0034618FDA